MDNEPCGVGHSDSAGIGGARIGSGRICRHVAGGFCAACCLRAWMQAETMAYTMVQFDALAKMFQEVSTARIREMLSAVQRRSWRLRTKRFRSCRSNLQRFGCVVREPRVEHHKSGIQIQNQEETPRVMTHNTRNETVNDSPIIASVPQSLRVPHRETG